MNRLQPFACIALLALPVQSAPLPEKVTIVSSSQYRQSCYPSLASLADDRLLCVFSVIDQKTGGKMVVSHVTSADNGRTWSEPRTLIDTPDEYDYDPSIVVIGNRVIVSSTTTPKGQEVTTSRTMAVRSEDNARTWSKVYEIPMGHRYTSGKINNGIVLRDGRALLPYTWEAQLDKLDRLPSEGDMIERSGALISKDNGLTWRGGGDVIDDKLKNPAKKSAISGICEPALVELSDGSVYMLARTGVEKLYESRSRDGGKTWSSPVPSPLTGHNAPAALCRFQGRRSGILVVWNNSPTDRWPLCVAASYDDAGTWTSPRIVANTPEFECSYPACIQAADGALVAAWQQARPHGREILAVRFRDDWLDAASSAAVAQTRSSETSGRFDMTEGVALPEGRGGHAAGLVENHIVVAGGNSWTDNRTRKEWHKDTLVFRDSSWEPGPELPHPLAYPMFTHDQTGLYLVGGTDGNRRYGETLHLRSVGRNARWKRLSSLPQRVSAGAASIAAGRLFVIGGEIDDGMTNRVSSLDLGAENAEWHSCSPLPGPARSYCAAFTAQDSVYVLGGISRWEPLTCHKDVYRYDPTSDHWEKLPDLAMPGYAWAASPVDDSHALLAGRASGVISDDIWLLAMPDMNSQPVGKSITPTTTAPLVQARPGEWWLIGGEPDSNKNRTPRVTRIRYALPE